VTVDVAIVGAGISGLAAAYELTKRGLSVRVLEAASRPGGVIRTDIFDDWVVDGGPDAFIVQKPGAVALCRELGIADRLVPTLLPRAAYVLRGGRLHPLAEGSFLGFPVTLPALAASPLFSIPGKLRMACEVLVPRATSDGDESIASFVRRRFGEEAVTYLAEPLLAGIHAGDVERLSIRALFPRLVEIERRAGSVLRGARAFRTAPSPQGAFVSLPRGTGELVETLHRALPAGTVSFDARVTELHPGGGFRVESAAGPVTAHAVVLAVPAYVAGALLRSCDTWLASLCESIAYASTVTVAFGYHRAQVRHPMQGSGFVVPRAERLAILAGTWVTSKWPGRAPEAHVLLRAFLGGGRDPSRVARSDEELIATARDELGRLMQIEGTPLFSRLYRWTRQSPQYEVGHLERVARIDARVAAIPGLFVAGSGFRAIGIPDCITDGRETAARAASYLSSRTRPAS
jgi:protoporphyrinogen/coproporphyrinogen III oxidase